MRKENELLSGKRIWAFPLSPPDDHLIVTINKIRKIKFCKYLVKLAIKIKVPALRSYLDINILFFSISLHCKLKESLFPEQAHFDAFLCCFFLLTIIGP